MSRRIRKWWSGYWPEVLVISLVIAVIGTWALTRASYDPPPPPPDPTVRIAAIEMYLKE